MNDNLPLHIAIIPDGNRRWAEKNGLSHIRGHEVGAERMFQIVDRLMKLGVRYSTVWGFSTDNWKRTEAEVFSLFELLVNWIKKTASWAEANEVRFRHIGRLEELPDNLKVVIENAVANTKSNNGMTLNVAFNYSGRTEIIDAINTLMARPACRVDETSFSKYLYTDGIPDVELVIRTAGEFRLSNFMIWQTAYSEFYFSPVYWPDFDSEELEKALDAYGKRIRRMGGD